MPTPTTHRPRRLRPATLIPEPAAVRDRLYRARAEARLLARLLRLSEDQASSATRHPAHREGVAHVA